MAICQFFLNGNCRFGDRCRNEHRRPERGSYNQGGRKQKSFNQDSHDYRSSSNHGGRESYNQGYRNERNYQENWDSQYGRGYGSSRGGGNRGGGSYGGNRGRGNLNRNDYYDYDNQGYNRNQRDFQESWSGHRDGGQGWGGGRGRGGYNQSRDKYHYDARDRNRFSLLDHQADPEPPIFDRNSQQTRDRTYSAASQQSVTVDQKIERVRKDMREWQETGQWPLSCYAPFANDPCLNGLLDISPEELRHDAYQANTTGNAGSYTQSLQQTMERYRERKQELTMMSASTLQDELTRSSQPSIEVPGGLLGNLPSSVPSLDDMSIFGENMSTTTSSTGLLGNSLSGSSPFMPHLASTQPFTTQSTPFGPSSSPVGSTLATNTTSSTPMLPQSQDIPSSSAQASTETSQSPAMTSLRCSEEDLKAFRADKFVLGAVPECPPPIELC